MFIISFQREDMQVCSRMRVNLKMSEITMFWPENDKKHDPLATKDLFKLLFSFETTSRTIQKIKNTCISFFKTETI